MKRKDRKWTYATRLTPFWLMYELTLCAIMLVAIAIYYVYTIRIVDGSVFQPQ